MLPEYMYPEKMEEEAWSVVKAAWEENNLSWFVRNSEEVLLRKVGDSKMYSTSQDPKEHKVNEVKDTKNEWKQKRMHGQYVREKEGII